MSAITNQKISNMRRFLLCLVLTELFFLASCGDSVINNETTTSSISGNEEVKAPAITIDETTWIITDLSAISNFIPVIVNLPKNVKMEKNGNGGVDIYLNEASTITVSNLAVSSVKEAIESDKSLYVNHSSYKNGKIITEEPNGFVYSKQMQDEANGMKYEPEAHFAYYLERDGAIYSILDVRPMDNFFLQGSTYTEENAKKLYNIVKNSAKLK